MLVYKVFSIKKIKNDNNNFDISMIRDFAADEKPENFFSSPSIRWLVS